MRNKEVVFKTVVFALFAACLGLFMALPAKAASLQLVPNWGAIGVPTNLSMYVYVPDKVAANRRFWFSCTIGAEALVAFRRGASRRHCGGG